MDADYGFESPELSLEETSLDGEMGNFLSDLWEDTRKTVIDPLVDKTLTTAGFTQAQADALKAQTGEAYKKELASETSNFLASVTGGAIGTPTARPAPAGTFQATLDNISKNPVVAAIPGGLMTIAALGGVGIYFLMRKR